MSLSGSRRRSGRQTLPAMAVLVSVFALVFAAAAPTANADDPAPTLNLTLTPDKQTVMTDESVVYTVGWSCVSNDVNCDNATLTVDIPRFVDPDGSTNVERVPEIVSATSSSGVVVSPTILRPNSRADGKITYKLGNVPAGTAGQLTVTLKVPRSVVPKDATVTPVVTFTADRAAAATKSTTTTVDGKSDLSVVKSGPTVPPLKDAEVTYTLHASYAASMDDKGNYTGAPRVGHVNAEDVILVDRLPACAVYVRSGASGQLGSIEKTPPVAVYNAANGTVIWNLGKVSEEFDTYFTVTVKYPSASCTQTQVTNEAEISGRMYKNSDVVVRDTADFSHTFGVENAKGSFVKYGSQAIQDRGGKMTWGYRFRNDGNLPLKFTGTDVLPCALASATGSPTCDTPVMKNVSFKDLNGLGLTIAYTTNLGRTGTITTSAAEQTPIVSDTEWITTIDVSGDVPAGVAGQVVLTGVINRDIPGTEDGAGYEQANLTDASYRAGASTDWVRVQNCLAPGAKFTTGSGKEIAVNRNGSCAWARVANERPLLNLRKLVYSGSPQAPGGAITFRFDVGNLSPNTPVSPVVTDLLPCGMTYVDGSTTMQGSGALPASGLQVDSSRWATDAAGCKRQILVFSWPGTTIVDSQWDWLTFQAKVGSTVKAGRQANEGQISPKGLERKVGDLTYCNSTMGQGVADVMDLNGNGRTDDMVCSSRANFDVVNNSSMSVVKEVKGSKDEDFLSGALVVGTVDPGKGAQYRLTASNTGNVDLDGVVLYDVLPFKGDTGVGPSAGSARGSAWRPFLTGPVTVENADAKASVRIEYSTSSNPCRGEVIARGAARASAPAGCVDDWTENPASYADVKAIRVEVRGAGLAPGQSVQALVPMNAPADAQGTAWNSVAMAGRESGGDWLLPIEPIKVGLEVTVDLALTKRLVDPQPAYGIGDVLHFQVTVKNLGPGDATDVRVLDLLPSGLEYVSSQTHLCRADGGSAPDPCQSATALGSYDPGTGVWTLFPPGQQTVSLPKDSTATIDIRAKLIEGSQGKKMANAASIQSAGQKDSVKDNDSSEVTWNVLYAIAGSVYRDSDMNAAKGEAEGGFGGVTVELRDSSGKKVDSTTTASDGAYRFDRVPEGTYEVVVRDDSPLKGTAQTQDPDGVKDAKTQVSVGPKNPSVAGLDFGFVGVASIGDRVWFDYDGDGIQDSGEPGVPGVKVTLYASGQPVTTDASGRKIAPVTTASDGSYSFKGLPAGRYEVDFEIPAGMRATVSGAGGDPALDSNGARATVDLAEGRDDGSVDLGLVGTGSIGDALWLDSNQNGAADPGEPGLAGVPVRLTWAGPDGVLGNADDRLYEATTGADGRYSVGDLYPGEYSVAVDADDVAAATSKVGDKVAATLQTFAPGAGALTGGSIIDANRGGKFRLSSKVTLSGTSMVDDAQDFAFAVPIDLSLTKRVQTSAPKGGYTPGAEVSYELNVANEGPGTATGVTVGDRLPAGVEFVSASGQGAYDPTTGVWTIGSLAPGASVRTVITVRAISAGDVVNTAEIATADQKDVDSTPGNGDRGEDDISEASFAAGYAVAGNVYRDSDASFTKGNGEPAIAGVPITLRDVNGSVVATTSTDANGHWEFLGLKPGRYSVESGGVEGLLNTQTYDKSGKNVVKVVVSDASVMDVNFGYVAPASIGDRVWHDSDGNGVQDEGEVGIGGVGVKLMDADGKTVASTTTDGSGAYRFGGLLPGRYEVVFTVPDGWKASLTGAGGDASRDSDGAKTWVRLREGEVLASIDLGLVQPSATTPSRGATDTAAGGRYEPKGTANQGVPLARTGPDARVAALVAVFAVVGGAILLAARRREGRDAP